MNRFAQFLLAALFWLAALCPEVLRAGGGAVPAKQEALDQWRALTGPAAGAPRVFVKGDHARLFFSNGNGVEAFSAHWRRLRVPTDGYRVSSAVMEWEQKLPRVPEGESGWREATVISGAEWRQLATNLVAALTPLSPMHGACYEAFLADGLVYRGAAGRPHFAPLGTQPKEVVVERRYSTDETLELLARLIEEHLSARHPGGSLFLMMAPNAEKFSQPLLLDRQQRKCVFLTPAVLYDPTERGFSLSATAEGVEALVLEGHGIALLKNPVSSVARLGDLGLQTAIRFLRLPLPKSTQGIGPVSPGKGMDLPQWEAWLDRYTGTYREGGSLQLLIDGEQFFPRWQQALAAATNHVNVDVYIFDRDDVAVQIAQQLKERAGQVKVKVLMDRMGSIGAGLVPPATPMPPEFVSPKSIASFLQQGSSAQVENYLNPWFTANHAKVLSIDGQRAWLGGMNLGHEYRYEWHDLMVEMQGPVVTSLEKEFRRKWAHASPLGDLAYLAALLSGPNTPAAGITNGSWIQVRLLPTKTGWKPFAAAVLGSLHRAQNYIYAENPYIFDKKVISALVDARRRGVDVRVVLPRVNDFKAGGRSNLVLANYLLEHGVRVYFYPAMTHVKALLVDDWACVGSGNLNNLSLRINQEQNVATSDSAFAGHLKRDLFEADFARSYELTEPISVNWVDFITDEVLAGF